jgi:hypothetical protein
VSRFQCCLQLSELCSGEGAGGENGSHAGLDGDFVGATCLGITKQRNQLSGKRVHRQADERSARGWRCRWCWSLAHPRRRCSWGEAAVVLEQALGCCRRRAMLGTPATRGAVVLGGQEHGCRWQEAA